MNSLTNNYDQNTSATFSDPEWMFNVTDGFDIVIGNPPYIQLQSLKGNPIQQVYRNQSYNTYAAYGDLYCLFYERGTQLVAQNGHLCYITSNQWMRIGYGEKVRSFLLGWNPRILIDLGAGVFESATVNTSLLLLQKAANQHATRAVIILDTDKQTPDLASTLQTQGVTLGHLDSNAWAIGSDAVQAIKTKIERLGKVLKEWNVSICRGVLTGFNEAFIIDQVTRDRLVAEDPKSVEILKPILRGRDIKRYNYEWAEFWLILAKYGSYKELQRAYHAVFKHLCRYETDLKQRGQCRYSRASTSIQKAEFTGQHHWLELDNNPKDDYISIFEQEKIVWGNLSQSASFTKAPAGMYVNAPCPMIAPYDAYICAVLNSRLGDFYIREHGVIRNGGYFEYKPMFVENLPIPSRNANNKTLVSQIECLVGRIFATKKAHPSADTSALEREIDQLVYQLYGLTTEEIAIVEGVMNKTGVEMWQKRRARRLKNLRPEPDDVDGRSRQKTAMMRWIEGVRHDEWKV